MLQNKGSFLQAVFRYSLYLYVVTMAAIFLQQSYKNVTKYRKMQIVEDISVEERSKAAMPPLTICLNPGYNATDMTNNEFHDPVSYCVRKGASDDIAACVDGLRMAAADLVGFAGTFTGNAIGVISDLADSFRPTSMNLVEGSCFTYQHKAEREIMPSHGEYVDIRLTGTPLELGWTLSVSVHDEGRFMPGALGDSIGQKFFMHKPEPSVYSWLTMKLSRRDKMEHDRSGRRVCEVDPGYDYVGCMEEYVRRTAGCASPWDVTPTTGDAKTCQSADEFGRLHAVHQWLAEVGTKQFRGASGCLEPCSYHEFDVVKRRFDGTLYTMGYEFNTTGLSVSLASTDIRVVADAYLYGVDDLIGDLGGCLGMFLGISLVSIYQMLLDLVGRATTKLK